MLQTKGYLCSVLYFFLHELFASFMFVLVVSQFIKYNQSIHTSA